jgi:hypothetical protein
MTSRAPALLLLALASLLACGEDADAPPPRDDTITPSLQNHCLAFHEALCQRQIGCNVALDNHATSVDACLQEARLLCEPRLATWTRSVELGYASFSADTLAQCRQELSQADCKALAAGRLPAACREVFQGDAADGEACYTDVECQGSLVCAAFGRCPGRCQAPDEDPEDVGCDLTGCPDDRFCDGRVLSAKTYGRRRLPQPRRRLPGGLLLRQDRRERDAPVQGEVGGGSRRASRGGSVSPGLSCQVAEGAGNERRCAAGKGQGAVCLDSDECGDGLICDGALGTCGAPAAEQEPCALTQDCAEGLVLLAGV